MFVIFYQVITVALRCPDGTVKKRRFAVQYPIKVTIIRRPLRFWFVM